MPVKEALSVPKRPGKPIEASDAGNDPSKSPLQNTTEAFIADALYDLMVQTETIPRPVVKPTLTTAVRDAAEPAWDALTSMVPLETKYTQGRESWRRRQ